MVRVASIPMILPATATGAARAAVPIGTANSLNDVIPTAAARRCPPITFRGWLKGTAGAPYTNAAGVVCKEILGRRFGSMVRSRNNGSGEGG